MFLKVSSLSEVRKSALIIFYSLISFIKILKFYFMSYFASLTDLTPIITTIKYKP